MKYLIAGVLVVFLTGCSIFKSGYTEVEDYDFTQPLNELQKSHPEIEAYSVFNNDYPYIEMDSIYKKWGEPDTIRTDWEEIGRRIAIVAAFGVVELLSWPALIGIEVISGPSCRIETWMKGGKQVQIESCPKKWIWARKNPLVKKWEWQEISQPTNLVKQNVGVAR